MSFFRPESARKSTEDGIYQYTPLLYRYDQWYETDTVTVDQNTLAWGTYTGGKVSPADLSKALYHHDDRPANGLVRWASANSPAALTYLQLAWRAEAAAPQPVNAWETDIVRRDTTTAPLRNLLAEAQSGYQTTRDAFLKERYAFQAVKLAALLKDFRRSVALYDELVRPLARKTFLSNWALCRHAGATMTLGDTAKAIYEFAQVFDRCPSRRQEAELSLRIYGIRFREKALEFCQNDHEKAAVYVICAIQPRQDALPYLKKIVRLDPKHPLIELIMAREINRNEYYFFQNNAPLYAFDDATRADSVRFADRRQAASSYFEQLETFARESAENQRLNDPAFWYTAASYLNYLNKNYDQAQADLEKADGALTTNPVLKKQITVQHMLLLAAQTETITPGVENKLIGYLETFGSSANFYINNAFVEVCKQFAAKYGSGKPAAQASSGWFASCSRKKDTPDDAATAKAFLLTALTSSQLNRNDNGYFLNQSDLYDIEDTTTVATVQNVIRFASQPDLSDFGKRLLRLTGFNNDQLSILLGRRLLVDNRLAEAADVYAKVAPNNWKAEPFTTCFNENPFRVNPTGKQHGAQHTNPYTPSTFLQRMIDLEKEAKTATGDQAAERYYELGCGAYNLSWFGNAWLLARPRWSGAEPSSNVSTYRAVVRQAETDRNFEKLATDPYYTNAPAKAFFERAMQLAKNPELAAKACFMAARCEQDAFRTRQDLESARRGYSMDQNQFDRDMKALKKRQYSTYLSKLSQAYATTHFNKETIRECATYADFLKGK